MRNRTMGPAAAKQRLTILSFMSLWIGIFTNSAEDLHEHKLTDSTCIQQFAIKVDNCVTDFLGLHQQLGLFHGRKRKISVIYISVHRDLYCRQYITSLQCIHDNLSSCSADTTTSLVQQKLSQLWALTANKICHINDKSADKTNTDDIHQVLPNQIHKLFKDGPVHILEENEILHDCSAKMLFENLSTDMDKAINEDSIESSDTNKHDIGDTMETEQEENTKINQSMTTKLDYLVSKFELLLQFLSYLFTPMKPIDGNVKQSTQTIILENNHPKTKDSRVKNTKVKYETVLVKKLKITNIEKYAKDKSIVGDSVTQPRHYNGNLENSVIKEFEVSKEDSKTLNKETKTTTFKWKTRMIGVLS